MFGLVDCNNFFVSCERVFDPALRCRPVVVLSNNDGCIIARSNEAKALKIPMGAPFFQYQEILERSKAAVFSANFRLYGDMSSRVIQTLQSFGLPLEIYSIDEVFIQFPKTFTDWEKIARDMVSRVLQWTGIPISIGIAPTKTLAKMANKIAKKKWEHQSFLILKNKKETLPFLESFPIEDIWGVGRSTSKFLKRHCVYTAKDFLRLDQQYLKKHLKSTGLRIFLELQGISCHSLEELSATRKSIVVSRSFSPPITSLWEIKRIIAGFTAKAAEKLRKEGLASGYLSVFIETSRFRLNYYSNSAALSLPEPSSFTPLLINCAENCLQKIFKENLEYKRGGILLSDFHFKNTLQKDLFYKNPEEKIQDRLMDLVDSINQNYGSGSLHFASENLKNKSLKAYSLRSKQYTTDWKDLLSVKIRTNCKK